MTVTLPQPNYEELGFSARACAYCGEAFYHEPGQGRPYRYCPEHRDNRYRNRVHRGHAERQASFLVRKSSYEELYCLLHQTFLAYSGQKAIPGLKGRIQRALERADGLR